MRAGPADAVLQGPKGGAAIASMIAQQGSFAPVPSYPVHPGGLRSATAAVGVSGHFPDPSNVLPYLRRSPDQQPAGQPTKTTIDWPTTVAALRRTGQGPRHGDETHLMVRRRVSLRGHPDQVDEQSKKFGTDAEKLLEAVDAATGKAYNQVLNRPLFTGLEGLAKADGYVRLWVERVGDELDGAPGAATAAQFGYAIESLATKLLGGQAEGWALSYQVSAGSTRPDIVAKKDGLTMWVDLTADLSTGHIYRLKQWDKLNVCQFPHAEVTYESLDRGARAVLLTNARAERAGTPNNSLVDSTALQEQIRKAQERLVANRIRWKQKHKHALDELPTVRFYAKTDESDADARARRGVLLWLTETFRTAKPFAMERDSTTSGARRRPRPKVRTGPYDRPVATSYSRVSPESEDHAKDRRIVEKKQQQSEAEQARLAGSILKVLGKNPDSYGFWVASVSEARGIAFLQEHDPGDEN